MPPPELNPLLNPVLGQHMGRWAEVYFTTHPEKREQAVLSLLHDLEQEPGGETFPESAPIQASREAEPSTPLPPPFEPFGENEAPFAAPETAGLPGFAATTPAGFGTSEIREAAESRLHWMHLPDGFSLLEVAARMEQRAQRYGVYLAAALVTLIACLAYMTWRDTMVWSGRARESSRRFSSSIQSVPLAPLKSGVNSGSGIALAAPMTPRPTQSKAASGPGTESAAPASRAKVMQPALLQEKVPVEHDAATMASSGSGSQELAVAKRFLEKSGSRRDPSEAAAWLWKAVRKQNAAAELMLSNLYLTGDGVPRNCEQARLLLDAAARKGVAGAGEQIRDLPAAGCK